MKLRQFVLDYLSFNRAEQRGLAILAGLIFALLVANRLTPPGPEELPMDVSSFEQEITLFRKKLEEAQAEEKKHQASGKPWQNHTIATATRYDTAGTRKQRQEPVLRIELNATDTLELQQLRGIGPGYARRIIRYRDRLGGFVSPDQLREVAGLSEELYQSLRPHVTVNAELVRRIDVNNASFKEMMRHPYFPYELTREIFLYRKKAKLFKNAEELRQVTGVNDSVFQKIKSYVEVK